LQDLVTERMPFVKPDNVALHARDVPTCASPAAVIAFLASTEAAPYFHSAWDLQGGGGRGGRGC